MFGSLKKAGIDWIVVFLGNPGEKYTGTRHNVGFMTADACGTRIMKSKFHALTAKTQLDGQNVFLMKPQTYMNLSGTAVAEAARFFKIAPERVIVVSDDVSLPLGKLRIRTGGSAGGHNGLKSIAESLGTQEFPRIKIGVGTPSNGGMVDWVLGTFKGTDAKTIAEAAAKAWDAACVYITQGPDAAMSKFN